jgi:hypothetical protein
MISVSDSSRPPRFRAGKSCCGPTRGCLPSATRDPIGRGKAHNSYPDVARARTERLMPRTVRRFRVIVHNSSRGRRPRVERDLGQYGEIGSAHLCVGKPVVQSRRAIAAMKHIANQRDRYRHGEVCHVDRLITSGRHRR